jgi:hypothetical protein
MRYRLKASEQKVKAGYSIRADGSDVEFRFIGASVVETDLDLSSWVGVLLEALPEEPKAELKTEPKAEPAAPVLEPMPEPAPAQSIASQELETDSAKPEVVAQPADPSKYDDEALSLSVRDLRKELDMTTDIEYVRWLKSRELSKSEPRASAVDLIEKRIAALADKKE